jgi:hypothetical protein
MTLEALKQAIADLERLVNDGKGDDGRRRPAVAVLSRLYATYAQATLEAHGISIDLVQLCGDRLSPETGGGQRFSQ